MKGAALKSRWLAAALVLACSDARDSEILPPVLPLPGFRVEPKQMTLVQGQEILFVASFSNWPYSQIVEWSISPDSVATLDKSGKIRALRVGVAQVTAWPAARPGAIARSVVTVIR
ncbi:MAG: Ig-like domain-containing protein [Gemmatimonadota bacterium]